MKTHLESAILDSLEHIPGSKRAQRLAYQACCVGFTGIWLIDKRIADEFLPGGKIKVKVIRQIGTWFNENLDIKDALLDTEVEMALAHARRKGGRAASRDRFKRLRTLEPGREEEFENLEKYYRAARKSLERSKKNKAGQAK